MYRAQLEVTSLHGPLLGILMKDLTLADHQYMQKEVYDI